MRRATNAFFHCAHNKMLQSTCTVRCTVVQYTFTHIFSVLAGHLAFRGIIHSHVFNSNCITICLTFSTHNMDLHTFSQF